VQELLTNALKTLPGHRSSALPSIQSRRLTIEVRDNGRGYNPRHLPEAGIGLQTISARLKLLKATYQDRSEPGKGSHFILEVPIRRQAPSPKR
jgi:signal transduction histidine kinase